MVLRQMDLWQSSMNIRIVYQTIISEPDHGMYEAINKGICAATGDVIGLLHSDDFFYDNHVISHIVKENDRNRS